MLTARVDFPSPPEGTDALDTLDATVVDISAGGVCMRIAMDAAAYRVMEQVSEGLFVEVAVSPSELRSYVVLGRVAWIWVPSMEDDDDVGSIGVDIKGVAEEDTSWLGKMRGLFAREDEVDVDRSSRLIRTRTARLAAMEGAEIPPEGAPDDAKEAEAEDAEDAEAEDAKEAEADGVEEETADEEDAKEAKADGVEEETADEDSTEGPEAEDEPEKV